MKTTERYQNQVDDLIGKGIATSEPHARTMIAAQLLLGRAYARLGRASGEAERYKGLAEKDPLTGLRRKESLIPVLDQVRQEFLNGSRSRLFLMQLDIDLFSWVNDVFECHFFGDLTLQAIGDIIRRHTRIGDFATRKGGEEFVIIPEYSEGKTEEIHSFAERLIGNIETDLLRTAVETMVNGKRTCKIKRNGDITTEEREGSIALREFACGLAVLKTQEEKRERFLNHAKGSREAKEKLLERILSLDITGYQEYIDDQRTWGELDGDNRQRRSMRESKIGEAAMFVFGKITCSAGVLCLTPADRETAPSATEIDAITEKLVYKAKRDGGNSVVVKLGLNGG